MNTVPSLLAQAVANECSSETVLWEGRPGAREMASRAFSGSWWLGIPWTAFAVFWTWGASGGLSQDGQKASIFFPLWGLMFVAVGCWMLLAPLLEYVRANRTYYVVTSRRVIIFEKLWSLKIRSFEASSLAGFERVSKGAEGGDLVFMRVTENYGDGTRRVAVGLLGLPDFKPAEAALKKLVETTRTRHDSPRTVVEPTSR